MDADLSNDPIQKEAVPEQVKQAKAKVTNQIDENAPRGSQIDLDTQDIIDRYEKGSIKVMLDSIFPRGGPLYGTTRVTVRAQGLNELSKAFPDPKCKFGRNQMIVEADYIKCTKKPLSFYDKEKGSQAPAKNETCIQCEASPKSDMAEIVSLTVSLSGKFDDVYSSVPFRYYKPLQVEGIYPRYGPKDGDTVV